MSAPEDRMTVNAVNAMTDIHEIRGPVGIPGDWLWLWILLGLLVLAAAVFFIVRTMARMKKAPVMPPLPAWQRALEAMARIEAAGYLPRGLIKQYYSELSDVVRAYIEERLDVRAPEMTTQEFIHAVRYSDKLTDAQQGFLRDFLNDSDMVKFAKHIPVAEDIHRAMRYARAFVEETR